MKELIKSLVFLIGTDSNTGTAVNGNRVDKKNRTLGPVFLNQKTSFTENRGTRCKPDLRRKMQRRQRGPCLQCLE